MKKLVVLISSLLLSLTVFSQTDTSNTKTFTIPVVRLIMKDLLSGDSAKSQLKLTEKQLVETEKKVFMKDSVIINLRAKEQNYLSIIEGEKEKFSIQKNYSNKLEKELKIEKVKNKFKSIVGTGVIAVLTILLIKK